LSASPIEAVEDVGDICFLQHSPHRPAATFGSRRQGWADPPVPARQHDLLRSLPFTGCARTCPQRPALSVIRGLAYA
jgi:hypothetical protein